MKTQGPRSNAEQRPSTEASQIQQGSDGAEDGDLNENAPDSGAARTLPPTLPKRRTVRPSQSTKQAAVKTAPAADNNTTVTATEPPADTEPLAPAAAVQEASPGSAPVSGIVGKAWQFYLTYENAFWLLI